MKKLASLLTINGLVPTYAICLLEIQSFIKALPLQRMVKN